MTESSEFVEPSFYPQLHDETEIAELASAAGSNPEDYLCPQIVEMFLNAQPKIEDIEHVKRSYGKLRRVLTENFPGLTSLRPFGSSLNGFGTRKGDLDVVAIFQSQKMNAKSLVYRTSSVLSKRGFAQENALWQAPKPVLTVHDKENDVHIDITFAQNMGIQGTHFLKAYASLNPKLQILGTLVKIWAKNRGLNRAAMGLLSSFNWLLLVIAFCQIKSFVPCLHKCSISTSFDSEVDIQHLKTSNPKLEFSSFSLGFLFRQFLEFFGWMEEPRAFDLSLGEIVPLEKPERGCIEIVSPFEPPKRCSASLSTSAKWKQIQGEMKRALTMISEEKPLMDILCGV